MFGLRLWGFIAGLAIIAGYAIGSGFWVQTSGAWYQSLRRPPWQPPDIVFGLIWPYNFLLLGVAAWVVTQRLDRGATLWWLGWLLASVTCALIWSQQFYGPHHLGIAAFALAIGALLTLPVLAITWRASTLVGALLVPYQLWMLVAASLSAGYWWLNARS